MSKHLTRMTRRVLRKVVTPGGLEIISDVSSSPPKLTDSHTESSGEGQQEKDKMEHSTSDSRLSSLRCIHNAAKLDDDSPLDAINRESLKAELPVTSKMSMAPEPVTAVDVDDDCEVFYDSQISLHAEEPTGSYFDKSLVEKRLILSHARSSSLFVIPQVIVSSPISSPRKDSIYFSLSEDDLKLGMCDNDVMLPPHPILYRAPSGSISPRSSCSTPCSHVSDIVVSVMESLGFDKNSPVALKRKGQIKSVSPDSFHQGSSTIVQENNKVIGTAEITPLIPQSAARYSLPTGASSVNVCQNPEEAPPHYDSQFPHSDGVLNYVSSIPEKCPVSYLDVRETLYNGAQTDDCEPSLAELAFGSQLEDLSCTETYCASQEKKLETARNRGVDEELKDTTQGMLSLQTGLNQNNPEITNPVSPRMTNESPSMTNESPSMTNKSPRMTHESERLEDTTCGTYSCKRSVRIVESNHGAKPDVSRLEPISRSCDSADPHEKNKMARSMRGTFGREQLLKKSYSFPVRCESLDEPDFLDGSPTFDDRHFDNTDCDFSFSDPEEDIETGADSKEVDENQYKINILSRGGSDNPYFYFKSGLSNSYPNVGLRKSKSDSSQKKIVLKDNWQAGHSFKTSLRDLDGETMEGDNCDSCIEQCGSQSENREACQADFSHNEAELEEPFEEEEEEEEEILQVIIESKGRYSENKNNFAVKQQSGDQLLRTASKEDNFMGFDTTNSCVSPLHVDQSQRPASVTLPHTQKEVIDINIQPGQVEDAVIVSTSSDSSKKSGNGDWSELEDAPSSNQELAKSLSRNQQQGELSPQYIELNYQDGQLSNTRDNSQPMNTNSQFISGDQLDKANDRGEKEFRKSGGDMNKSGNREWHNYCEDISNSECCHCESVKEISSSGKMLMERHLNGVSKQSNGHHEGKDLYASPLGIIDGVTEPDNCNTHLDEVTEPDNCNLYLKRRRKPVFVHALSSDKHHCIACNNTHTHYGNFLRDSHCKSSNKSCPVHEMQQIHHRFASVLNANSNDPFYQNESLPPTCPHSVHINRDSRWDAKCPNELQNCYALNQFVISNTLPFEDSIWNYNLHNCFPTEVEYFKEYTLTPTRYRQERAQTEAVSNTSTVDSTRHTLFQEPANDLHALFHEPVNDLHSLFHEPVSDLHSISREPANDLHSMFREPTNDLHSMFQEPTNDLHSVFREPHKPGESCEHFGDWTDRGDNRKTRPLFPHSGCMTVLPSPGDRLLTPTKFRLRDRNHDNRTDNSCDTHSIERDVNWPTFDETSQSQILCDCGCFRPKVAACATNTSTDACMCHGCCIHSCRVDKRCSTNSCSTCRNHNKADPKNSRASQQQESGWVKDHNRIFSKGYKTDRTPDRPDYQAESHKRVLTHQQSQHTSVGDSFNNAIRRTVEPKETHPSTRNCTHFHKHNGCRHRDIDDEHLRDVKVKSSYPYTPDAPKGGQQENPQPHDGRSSHRRFQDCDDQNREREHGLYDQAYVRFHQQRELLKQHSYGNLQDTSQRHHHGQHSYGNPEQQTPPHQHRQQQHGESNDQQQHSRSSGLDQIGARLQLINDDPAQLRHLDCHHALQQLQQQQTQSQQQQKQSQQQLQEWTMPSYNQVEIQIQKQNKLHHLMGHSQDPPRHCQPQQEDEKYQRQELPLLQPLPYQHQELPELQPLSYQHQELPELQPLPYQHQELPELQPLSYQHQELPELQPLPYELQADHVTSLRRQSTVETMDSGIMELGSHYSAQTSHSGNSDDEISIFELQMLSS